MDRFTELRSIFKYVIVLGVVSILLVVVFALPQLKQGSELRKHIKNKEDIELWAGEDFYNTHSSTGFKLFMHWQKDSNIKSKSGKYIDECVEAVNKASNQLEYEQLEEIIIVNANIDDFQVIMDDSLYRISFGINGEFDKAVFIKLIEETEIPYIQITEYLRYLRKRVV